MDQHEWRPRMTNGRYAADGKACRFAYEIGLGTTNFLADRCSRFLFVDSLVAQGDDEHWAAARPVRKTSDLAISATAQPIAAAASAAVRVPASNSSTVKRSPSTAWTLTADGAVAGFIALTKRAERPF